MTIREHLKKRGDRITNFYVAPRCDQRLGFCAQVQSRGRSVAPLAGGKAKGQLMSSSTRPRAALRDPAAGDRPTLLIR